MIDDVWTMRNAPIGIYYICALCIKINMYIGTYLYIFAIDSLEKIFFNICGHTYTVILYLRILKYNSLV